VTESVHEEVAFGAENLGLPREETLRRVSGALKSAGIEHLADRHPYALSGGQQQRVAFASVLVMQPRVLVLDEPTSQLDPIGSDEVFEVIRKLHSEGYTIVLAEHKVEALAELATRVIVLDEGKLVMDGSPRDVLGNRQLGLHRVLPPVYTRLSEELAKRGLWEPETPPLTIGEAAEIVKGILVGDS
jgi:energy-coupling factor transporter ATP-binding protein EcfA2